MPFPVIPEEITVHLGAPSATAENVTLPFADYIKNVASSEIYPTWPESAIRANIYAQISFALNRVFTEFYPSRGYDFDITNTTANDQAFVKGRDIFENISRIVDEIFRDYVRRIGSVEPLFTQYCNGTTTTCDGLSQWGTVPLAEAGKTPIEILQNYYGNDIEIVTDAPVQNSGVSAPLRPLRRGSTGVQVETLQVRLNRISENYPAIPKIYPVNGVYDDATVDAVTKFQEIWNLAPDGITGNATWYAVLRVYNAVKRLSELNSEGLSYTDVNRNLPRVLREGDSGVGVEAVQYLLAYVAAFNNAIPSIAISGNFDAATTEAVRAFQAAYDVPVDGIVGAVTYAALYDAYRGILATLPADIFENIAAPYPGRVLVVGSSGEDVRNLQTYLSAIASTDDAIPGVSVTGVYGSATEAAVSAFQAENGLPVTGNVGIETWRAIASVYDDLQATNNVGTGQFPGETLRGSTEGGAL